MSDIRTKQERLIDAIGDTSDKNVAIAVGAASEGRELKREVKRIEVITPEIPGKKAVKRSVLTRVISLAAAAVLLTVGTCYLFGILRIQDRIRPYKPAYEASEHSPTWKSAKEATGMEWTQLTEAEKTFDSSAVKTDASAKLREYNVHALWYKFDGKTLILRYDVEYTGWWSISPDMAGFGQLPSIWTFSFRKQADAMNADNYDQDAFRGAVTDVIGIDRSIWECACKIEFDEPRDRTELYAIKSYEGVNNYDDPYLLTAQKTAEYIIHTDVEMPDDPLMYYTDNNMPEPFEPADPDRPLTYSDADLHDDFTGLWQRKFLTLENIVPYLENTEKVDELYETYRAEQQYDRQAGNVTRYRIDDTVNLYRFMKDLGMSGEEMEAAVTKMDEENRPLVDEGNLSYDVLFDLYEGIFGRENKEDMALTFKSDYVIAVGEYVFSPRWMYYHTIEDYNKVGITATQVGLMLERYRELGLTDEAWTAFFKKLNGYITYYKKTTETRIYPVRDEDCYGMTFSEALDILEQHFYGSWKRKPALDGEYGTVTFTYSQDIFDHAGFHRPLRMGETDDIWYMECMSSGESEVWVIEKSDPTVMYCTGLVYYNGYDGRPALNLDAEWVTKYEFEETLTVNELRPGKISVLGMDKLLSIYGDDFISFYYEVTESGYMSDYGDYYVVGNDMMTAGPDMYLVGRSDDSVTLGIRYFKEDEYRNYLNDAGEEPTEYYFAVTFTLRENAGWSYSYSNLSDVYADIPVQTYYSSQMERYIAEARLYDVQLRGDHICFRSGSLKLTDTMDTENTEITTPENVTLGNAYLAATDGYYCRKDVRVITYPMSGGKLVIAVWFPMDDYFIPELYLYDGRKLDVLHGITDLEMPGAAFEDTIPKVADISDLTVSGNTITVKWANGGITGYTLGSGGDVVERLPGNA